MFTYWNNAILHSLELNLFSQPRKQALNLDLEDNCFITQPPKLDPIDHLSIQLLVNIHFVQFNLMSYLLAIIIQYLYVNVLLKDVHSFILLVKKSLSARGA